MIKGLPEKLRNQRVNSGFSQREVAKRLKVSPSIISSYETGERTPSAENLLSLSYLYHCSVDYLLGKESVAANAVISVEGLTPQQAQLLRELVETMRHNAQ